jgi:hypothetical protein
MQFKLTYQFEPNPSLLQLSDSVLTIGSCFAQNMGELLVQHKFNASINPSGILFNPMSISQNLRNYLHPEDFEKSNSLFFHQELWHSWQHHGKISGSQEAEIKQEIDSIHASANEQLKKAKFLIITWGSAFVFEHKEFKKVVANCHKVPNTQFHKRLLEPKEIVEDYRKLIHQIEAINPHIQVIWSISPVKYLKDGLHQNNLSKSVLFLALNQLLQEFPKHYYFPAFELVQDELRDYRFYEADFAHPTQQAIQYVWEQFITHCIHSKTADILPKIAEITQAMQHRPLHPETEAFQKFRLVQTEKIRKLQQEIPGINWEKELQFFA